MKKLHSHECGFYVPARGFSVPLYIAENSAILMKLIDEILDVSYAENDESILTTKRYNVDEMCANAMRAVDTAEPSSRDSNSDIH